MYEGQLALLAAQSQVHMGGATSLGRGRPPWNWAVASETRIRTHGLQLTLRTYLTSILNIRQPSTTLADLLKAADGRSIALRGPKKSAGNSERGRPPIPIELGQGWSRPAVAPSFRAGVLISIFDRLGVKFLAPGGGIAQAGA